MKCIKKKDSADNPSATVYNLLAVLNIPATYSYVNKTLKEHPDYSSLLLISEILPDWGVITEGVKGNVTDLSDADYPSIVHLNTLKSGRDFAVLEKIENGYVNLIHSSNGYKRLKLEEFAKEWSEVLLRTVPSKKTGEPDYKNHRKKQLLNKIRLYLIRIGLPVLFLIAFGRGLAQVESMGTLIPLSLAKAFGLVFCSVMTAVSLGQGNLLRSLCPMGKVANCARVIRSPAGYIFGLSMAEWGLLYFGGGLLALVLSFYFGQVSNDLFFITLPGIPLIL